MNLEYDRVRDQILIGQKVPSIENFDNMPLSCSNPQ